MINAIILAAGQSERMGKPKPLLTFKDQTFLEHIIEELKLSDIDKITVVLGANADNIQGNVDLSETNVVINSDYLEGQLSSLKKALKNLPENTQAILLVLVDHPFFTKELINEIVKVFHKTNNPIIVPVFNNKRGHPTLFSKAVFAQLLDAPKDQGARYVLHSNKEKIFELTTAQSGILIGIDTPDEYRFHFGIDP